MSRGFVVRSFCIRLGKRVRLSLSREVRMATLETERKYLQSHKDELLKQYGGKFLVISGEQVTGAYATIEDALQNSVTMHGLNSVLIRQAGEAEIEFSAPALTLGILSADSTHSTGSSS